MRVKTKKLISNRIIRLEGNGEIKEVLIRTDILEPQKNIISICFRGKNSSGMVDLLSKEAEDLSKTLNAQLKLLKTNKSI